MSALDELESEGLVSARQLSLLKKRAKAKAAILKRQRSIIDKQARVVFNSFLENGRSWKGLKTERAIFRQYMAQRHALHKRISKLVPEAVEPEWDSP